MATAHPGFAAVQSSIAKKEGVSKESAGAILASRTRDASAAAKKKNPNLDRVNGAVARRIKKRGAEGSPMEEATESKAEAKREGDTK